MNEDIVSALRANFPVCPTCALPAHASESDDDHYHQGCRPPVEVHADREKRKTKRKLCSPDQHVWSPIRGTSDERCTTCGTRFPCRPSCGHYDCCEARGEPSPLAESTEMREV